MQVGAGDDLALVRHQGGSAQVDVVPEQRAGGRSRGDVGRVGRGQVHPVLSVHADREGANRVGRRHVGVHVVLSERRVLQVAPQVQAATGSFDVRRDDGAEPTRCQRRAGQQLQRPVLVQLVLPAHVGEGRGAGHQVGEHHVHDRLVVVVGRGSVDASAELGIGQGEGFSLSHRGGSQSEEGKEHGSHPWLLLSVVRAQQRMPLDFLSQQEYDDSIKVT